MGGTATWLNDMVRVSPMSPVYWGNIGRHCHLTLKLICHVHAMCPFTDTAMKLQTLSALLVDKGTIAAIPIQPQDSGYSYSPTRDDGSQMLANDKEWQLRIHLPCERVDKLQNKKGQHQSRRIKTKTWHSDTWYLPQKQDLSLPNPRAWMKPWLCHTWFILPNETSSILTAAYLNAFTVINRNLVLVNEVSVLKVES